MFTREIFDCVDLHAGGEPLRLILSGYPPLPKGTVLDLRDHLRKHLDSNRELLMSEPWGHRDMYGCLLVPPEREGSAAGLIFMHHEGYSTMCGHATIAVATYLVEAGQVPVGPDGVAHVTFDVPSGEVRAEAFWDGKRVTRVRFESVPAFVVERGRTLTVRDREVRVDIAFGGAFYAVLEAAAVGCQAEVSDLDALRGWLADLRTACEGTGLVRHPADARLDGLYGAIFTAPPHVAGHHSRNVTVFADGQVDRSPCGSCLTARLAVLGADGALKVGQPIQVESVIGLAVLGADGALKVGQPIQVESVIDTVFEGEILGAAPPQGPYPALRTAISGSAHVTGFRRFYRDPEDPIPPFFVP